MHLTQCFFRCQLNKMILNCGGSADDFKRFIEDGGTGEVQMHSVQAAAEASGIAGCYRMSATLCSDTYCSSAGVPHYAIPSCITPDKRERGFFGREHLALIRRWLHVRVDPVMYSLHVFLTCTILQAQGLQRHGNVNPHISHAWTPT